MTTFISPRPWPRTSGWPVSPLLRCFALTLGISLVTRRTKNNEELKGLVYSLTPKVVEEGGSWFLKPAVLGVILLAACVGLNYYFW